MDNQKIAIAFAKRIHRGKKDSTGAPHFEHILSVVAKTFSRGGDDDALVVAALHDAVEYVEDSGYTLDFFEMKFGIRVRHALEALWQRPGERVEEYLERVSANPLASMVKAADLEDAMDIGRYECGSEFAMNKADLARKELEFLMLKKAPADYEHEELAESAEETFAKKELASAILALMKKRCPRRTYQIFYALLFHGATHEELARRYDCGVGSIHKHKHRAWKILYAAARELVSNLPQEYPDMCRSLGATLTYPRMEPDYTYSPPSPLSTAAENDTKKDDIQPIKLKKASRPGDIMPITPRSEQVRKQTAPLCDPPAVEIVDTDALLKDPRERSPETHAASAKKKTPSLRDCSVPFRLLARFLVWLIIFAGGWFLYDTVTPATKDIAFERVIIQPSAGSELWGDIQSVLHIDGPKGRHQVPVASMVMLRTRPEPGSSPQTKHLSDKLTVYIATTDDVWITGVTSRWITYKQGGSAKYMDLLALKEIRSDFTCATGVCPEPAFTVRLEHLPFSTRKTGS